MPKKKTDRRRAQVTSGIERRKTGNDRRKDDRAVLDVDVDLDTAGLQLYAYITDVSARGVFVLTNNPRPKGTRLRLRFALPGEEKPIVTYGKVRWIREATVGGAPAGMGVQFSEIDASTLQKLSAFIKDVTYLDEESHA
jgi:uncharacterized protein (TIGR02266 family)